MKNFSDPAYPAGEADPAYPVLVSLNENRICRIGFAGRMCKMKECSELTTSLVYH